MNTWMSPYLLMMRTWTHNLWVQWTDMWVVQVGVSFLGDKMMKQHEELRYKISGGCMSSLADDNLCYGKILSNVRISSVPHLFEPKL